MAQKNDPKPKVPPAPEPIAPRDAVLTDGRAVTFEWEPVEGAVEYRLEVAPSAAFDTLVYEQTVTGRTSLTVEGVFPPDGDTYYWRVLARNEVGWSPGDLVESFISTTPEEAAQHLERPDEELGPYPELIKSAAVEATAEATGDEAAYEEEEAAGVEHEGVEAGQVLGLAAAIIAAIIIIIIMVFFWVGWVYQETYRQAATLSRAPELRDAEEAAQRQLGQYGMLDEEENVYRIPIERAMDLMVDEALQGPDRPYSPELPLIPRVQGDTTAPETPGPTTP